VPPRRLVAPPQTVTLRVDGNDIPAIAGEPVAVAVAASGRLLLARSVKYHRPRGPACFSGRCDGCLMRVDGVGNVMTCRIPAHDGMRIETQNVLGSADTDLLAATDWFFPGGMNHHEMFTANKLLNRAMQKVARRIAGIGELPAQELPLSPLRDIVCDVLVIGGGAAGLLAATESARAGASTVLLEEGPEPGGQLRIFPGPVHDDDGRAWNASTLVDELAHQAGRAGVRILTRHAAVGIYGREVLAHAHEYAVRVRARQLVLATGTHEGAVAFEGSDLPGVMGVRAACALLRYGVLPGERVAIVGEGTWCEALAAALGARRAEVLGPFAPGAVRRARGRPSVRGIDVVRLDEHGNEQLDTLACDLVAVAPPPSPAFELAEQAGARVAFDGNAFVVSSRVTDGESAAAGVFVIGACAGVHALSESLVQARAAGLRAAASGLELHDGR
jgi:sarcosine oxidase subunit alpha